MKTIPNKILALSATLPEGWEDNYELVHNLIQDYDGHIPIQLLKLIYKALHEARLEERKRANEEIK